MYKKRYINWDYPRDGLDNRALDESGLYICKAAVGPMGGADLALALDDCQHVFAGPRVPTGCTELLCHHLGCTAVRIQERLPLQLTPTLDWSHAADVSQKAVGSGSKAHSFTWKHGLCK
jgi:hypothetical protein